MDNQEQKAPSIKGDEDDKNKIVHVILDEKALYGYLSGLLSENAQSVGDLKFNEFFLVEELGYNHESGNWVVQAQFIKEKVH